MCSLISFSYKYCLHPQFSKLFTVKTLNPWRRMRPIISAFGVGLCLGGSLRFLTFCSDKSTSPTMRRPPSTSPFTSRANPSPDGGSVKKKTTNVTSLKNPDLGPFFQKLARDAFRSGDLGPLDNALGFRSGDLGPLEDALGDAKCVVVCAVDGESNLDLAMSLRSVAALYCNSGKFEEGLSVLERAVKVVDVSAGTEHALAVSLGYMQMGDVYNMMERMDRRMESYKKGVQVQIDALGDKDPRVAEAFSYLAKAHIDVQQFDEAESLCKKTLEIHRLHSPPASLEEAADRQLMARICEARGDYESALEHLILASRAMIANGQENEVAVIEAHIGEMFYSVGRYVDSRSSFDSVVTRLRANGEIKSAFFGIVLNKMGLACGQLSKIAEAVELFQEAREILERECGPSHPDTLGVDRNLALIYENLRRMDGMIELLEDVLKLRKEGRGTTDNLIDFDDKEIMVNELLRRAGKRNKEEKSRGNSDSKETKK